MSGNVDWRLIPIPANPRTVQEFLKLHTQQFTSCLDSVREMVGSAVQHLGIYKLYGRDEKQSGSVLKDPRKVRLKLNSYYSEKSERVGSLWSVPDIIGFTIVVAYPSDINPVSACIDILIDQKRLANASKLRSPSIHPNSHIKTKYGRSITEGGYFACHYNVMIPGPGGKARIDRPVCEIQIKTVLHDAWGAKTHDLTYKPSGRMAQELIDSFNVLGDTLALIDRQSDLIRHSIERNAKVREEKRRRLQMSVLKDVSIHAVKTDDGMYQLIQEIVNFNPSRNTDDEVLLVKDRIDEFYDINIRQCAIALCLLALKSRNRFVRQAALDTLDTWLQDSTEEIRKVSILMMTGLANYCFDDVSAAIEATELAQELLSSLPVDGKYAVGLGANVYANLAYYHAVRVGSHEGRLGDSVQLAIKASEEIINHVEDVHYPANGLQGELKDIIASLSTPTTGYFVFSLIDTSAFVKIQTTDDREELIRTIDKLREVHRILAERSIGPDWPISSETRQFMIDYNDYCARMRLAELESKNYNDL